MKTGSIVYAKYPRRDGHSMGIVLEFKQGGTHYFGILAPKAKVHWVSTGKTEWYKAWDLELGL